MSNRSPNSSLINSLTGSLTSSSNRTSISNTYSLTTYGELFDANVSNRLASAFTNELQIFNLSFILANKQHPLPEQNNIVVQQLTDIIVQPVQQALNNADKQKVYELLTQDQYENNLSQLYLAYQDTNVEESIEDYVEENIEENIEEVEYLYIPLDYYLTSKNQSYNVHANAYEESSLEAHSTNYSTHHSAHHNAHTAGANVIACALQSSSDLWQEYSPYLNNQVSNFIASFEWGIAKRLPLALQSLVKFDINFKGQDELFYSASQVSAYVEEHKFALNPINHYDSNDKPLEPLQADPIAKFNIEALSVFINIDPNELTSKAQGQLNSLAVLFEFAFNEFGFNGLFSLDFNPEAGLYLDYFAQLAANEILSKDNFSQVLEDATRALLATHNSNTLITTHTRFLN